MYFYDDNNLKKCDPILSTEQAHSCINDTAIWPENYC